MATIQIFDPALCCSTGVCGVEVDQALVSFGAMETIRAAYWINLGRTAIVGAMTAKINDSVSSSLD